MEGFSQPHGPPEMAKAPEERLTSHNAKALEEKGYFCAKGYFTPDEVSALVDAYNSKDDYDHGQVVKGTYRTAPLPEIVKVKVQRLISQIVASTSVHLDQWMGSAEGDEVAFMVSKMFHDWHQDHESYYAANDHHNYINLYVPIRKPDRSLTNLCVVPFDKLRNACPPVHDACLNGGASRFVHYRPPSGKALCARFDDASGTNELYDCDLEELKETPQVRLSTRITVWCL